VKLQEPATPVGRGRATLRVAGLASLAHAAPRRVCSLASLGYACFARVLRVHTRDERAEYARATIARTSPCVARFDTRLACGRDVEGTRAWCAVDGMSAAADGGAHVNG
jgi:hypothetical protein